MAYRITGVGLEPLECDEATLARAAYLARKMADQGVSDIHVFDGEGRELSAAELRDAPLPPGWIKL
jgi:hypothetical protein